MRILCVIPARYKSSRFPGKPLVDIHGKPMIVRVFEKAAQVRQFSEVVVATDDERIAAACAEHGVATVMTSGDHVTGTDRVGEVARKVEADLYVNVQGDEPMIAPETIEAAIAPFEQGRDVAVTNLMTRIQRQTDLLDSTVPKVVVNARGEAVYLSRQPVPYPKEVEGLVYYKQVCVYGFTPQALEMFCSTGKGPAERAEDIELLRFIENRMIVQMIEVPQDTVAVDTPSDLEHVRALLAGAL